MLATAYSICQYAQIEHGSGHHIAAVAMRNPSDPIEAQKWAYAAQLLIIPALMLPKLSICLSYLRIFYSDVQGRRMIQVVMAILIIQVFPFFIENIFQCKPIYVYWTEGRPSSKCLHDTAALYINGSLNAALDIALMAIVLPRILELHINKRQKWALIGIISLGSFAVIAAIIRMVRVGTTIVRPDFDPTWDMYDVSIWSSMEIYVSLICASAPGIKPLVSKLLPKLLGSSLYSRTRTLGNAGQHGGSIELSSKFKRGTVGSVALRKNTNEFGLAGPYTQVGRGVDKESLGGKSEDENSDRAIFKTSEIRVETEDIRQ